MNHGTANCYWHRPCRRPECRQAATEYQREYRRRRKERPTDDIPDEVAVERAAYGDRKVPLSRLEVAEVFAYLNAHGYTAAEIALRLGVTPRTVWRWRTGRTTLPFGRRSGNAA